MHSQGLTPQWPPRSQWPILGTQLRTKRYALGTVGTEGILREAGDYIELIAGRTPQNTAIIFESQDDKVLEIIEALAAHKVPYVAAGMIPDIRPPSKRTRLKNEKLPTEHDILTVVLKSYHTMADDLTETRSHICYWETLYQWIASRGGVFEKQQRLLEAQLKLAEARHETKHTESDNGKILAAAKKLAEFLPNYTFESETTAIFL